MVDVEDFEQDQEQDTRRIQHRMAGTPIRQLLPRLTLLEIFIIVVASIPITLVLQYFIFGEYWSCELKRDQQHLYKIYKPLLDLLDITGEDL